MTTVEVQSSSNVPAEEPEGFLGRIKFIFNTMMKSRLVDKQECDEESMRHFQKLCNESLPCNEHEHEIKHAVRTLYYADKATFNRFLHRLPYYVLLTDARNIVYNFGIHEFVFISYDDTENTYHVARSEKREYAGRRYRTGTRRNDFQHLYDRINALEEQLHKPQVVPLTPFVEGQKQIRQPRVRRGGPQPKPVVSSSNVEHVKRSQNPYEALKTTEPESPLSEAVEDHSDWADDPMPALDEKKD